MSAQRPLSTENVVLFIQISAIVSGFLPAESNRFKVRAKRFDFVSDCDDQGLANGLNF